MKKRAYRSVDISMVNVESLSKKVKGKRIAVGTDVAKEDYYACLMDEQREVVITTRWKHPLHSRTFVNLIKDLPASSIQVAMEPSGSYGDPVRQLLMESGIEVFRVSPKRSHDAAEVYDGVASLHDAKSGAIIAKLHLDGASEPWPIRGDQERELSAVINTMDMLHKQFHQNVNRLEALMARYWPEVSAYMNLDSATFLELVGLLNGPGQVAVQPKKARRLMQAVGGRFLGQEKIDKVIESAQNTIGLKIIETEEEELGYLAQRTRELQRELNKAKKKVERLSQGKESTREMGKVVGKATAAVVVSGGGDPLEYDSASQWVKSLGLNLKEKSSGKYKGKLTITKRGSGQARRWLYFAVLRLIQTDEIVRAWYARKIARDGGIKMKAIIAIMRKLAGALWHVARAETFDTRKLFNVERLGLCKG